MLPLDDVRVIAVEQYGAGPFGSVHLADLGADVIKIEDPRVGGDVGRYVPPYQSGEDSLFFETFNRNKRSVCLDLTTDGGPRRLPRPRARERRGLLEPARRHPREAGPDVRAPARTSNERIVCCSLTGFGTTGPRRAEPAYDYILQGLAGWMSTHRRAGRAAGEERAFRSSTSRPASSPRSRSSSVCTPRAGTESGWTATSRSSTSRSAC